MRMAMLAALAAAALMTWGAAAAQPGAAAPRAGDIPDTWILESHGSALCKITLTGGMTPAGYFRAQAPGDCGAALPGDVVGWKPTPDGLVLVGADGSPRASFDRWSESLFVARYASASDVQLTRAPIGPPSR